jgi:FolB domain-containing protein
MDCILIEDLQARCVIGIDPRERREKQDVVISLRIWADLGRACRSDDFEQTVDYRAIENRVLAMVEQSQYRLVEALAEAVARECLADAKVRRVRVRVAKPAAPRFARAVGVEITRRRA